MDFDKQTYPLRVLGLRESKSTTHLQAAKRSDVKAVYQRPHTVLMTDGAVVSMLDSSAGGGQAYLQAVSEVLQGRTVQRQSKSEVRAPVSTSESVETNSAQSSPPLGSWWNDVVGLSDSRPSTHRAAASDAPQVAAPTAATATVQQPSTAAAPAPSKLRFKYTAPAAAVGLGSMGLGAPGMGAGAGALAGEDEYSSTTGQALPTQAAAPARPKSFFAVADESEEEGAGAPVPAPVVLLRPGKGEAREAIGAVPGAVQWAGGLWGEVVPPTLPSVAPEPSPSLAAPTSSGSGMTGTYFDRVAPPLSSRQVQEILQHPSQAGDIARERRRHVAASASVQAAVAGSEAAIDPSMYIQPDLWSGTWRRRVVQEPVRLLAHKLEEALQLGLVPAMPGAPRHSREGEGEEAGGTVASSSQAQALVPVADLAVQALFGVGSGTATEITRGKAAAAASRMDLAKRSDSDGGEGGQGGRAVETMAGVRLQKPSNLSDLPQLAVEISLRKHHHGTAWYRHWGGALVDPATGRKPEGEQHLPRSLPLPLCGPRGSVGENARIAADRAKGVLPAAAALTSINRTAAAVKIPTALRSHVPGAGPSSTGGLKSKEDTLLGGASAGMQVMEYLEPWPLFIPPTGVSGRLITYYRARSMLEISEVPVSKQESGGQGAGGEGEDEEVGGGVTTMVRKALHAPRPPPGAVLEVLRPHDPEPLLGGIRPGEAITCFVTPLFVAPVARHPARKGVPGQEEQGEDMEEDEEEGQDAGGDASKYVDFLMICTSEEVGAGEDKGTEGAGSDGWRKAKVILREIKHWWSVGQQQPKVEIPTPPFLGHKGSQFVDPSLQGLLRAYACWHLLAFMEAEDAAYERLLIAEGKVTGKPRLPEHYTGRAGAPRLQVGVVSAAAALDNFWPALEAEVYKQLVEPVATYELESHTLTRRIGKTSAAARAEYGLTLERVACFESMRCWADLLPRMGVKCLRVDDRAVDESLRLLQTIADRSTEKLQAVLHGSVWGGSEGSGGGGGARSRELWELDGGYQRVKHCLSTAQAVHFALASTPWHVSRNMMSYIRDEDAHALAMAEPQGACDPSNRGEFFAWLRDLSTRGLNAAVRARLANKQSRKEGTDKDLRTLTMPQLASILLDYGRKIEEIRGLGRWERVAAIREVQNAELARQGGAGAAAGLLFVGETKLTARDKRRAKDSQAREILSRQLGALARVHELGGLKVAVTRKVKAAAAVTAGAATGTAASAPSTATAAGMDEEAAAVGPTASPGGAQGGAGEEEEQEEEEDAFGFADELAQELERRFENRAGQGASRAANSRLAAAEAAQEAERAEFAAIKAALREGRDWTQESSATAAAAAQAAAAKAAEQAAVDPLTLARSRHPGLPDVLLLKAPDDVPLTTHQPPPGMTMEMRVSRAREGSKNPEPVHALDSLTSMGPRAPVFTRDPVTGAVQAQGKVLRIVRTVIDESGTQRVLVTYSTNMHAIQQAWVKRARGIDLGSFGAAKDIDADGKGLVAVGLYRSPTDRATARRPSLRADVLLYRAMYDHLKSRGIIPRGGKRDAAVPRILMHGAIVQVCSTCEVFGHRKAVCPFHPDFRKEAGAAPEKNAGEIIKAAREKVVAGIAQKKTYSYAGVAAAAAGAGVKRKADEYGAGAGAGAGKSAGPVSRTSSMRYRLMDGSDNGAPATREFATILEKQLSLMHGRDIFDPLWDMTERPAAAGLPEQHKMDLKTLRRNVVLRMYRSWDEVNEELHRLTACARLVYSDKMKLASRFCKDLREWHRGEVNRLKKAAGAIERAGQGRAIPMIEQYAEEILRAGYRGTGPSASHH